MRSPSERLAARNTPKYVRSARSGCTPPLIARNCIYYSLQGKTAVLQAAAVGLADSVNILLDARVDPHKIDNSGMGILQLAKNSSGAVRNTLYRWKARSGEDLKMTYAVSQKKYLQNGPQVQRCHHSKLYWPIHRVP